MDLAPFLEAAALLYDGAFVAERYTAVGAFVDTAPAADLDPTVAHIITAARDIPAHRLFADRDRLAVLRDAAMAALSDADALLLPTAPGHPTLAEVAADPLGANARLGRFTNSTNLFGLCAVAAPAGDVAGHPFGVMLIGPAHTDERLARITALLTPPTRLVVAGAHLTGQPLNPQLLSLGAHLLRTTTTAPVYRLHALRTDPPKPGLERVGEGGAAIEVEVWELPLRVWAASRPSSRPPWHWAGWNSRTAQPRPASCASPTPCAAQRTSRSTAAGAATSTTDREHGWHSTDPRPSPRTGGRSTRPHPVRAVIQPSGAEDRGRGRGPVTPPSCKPQPPQHRVHRLARIASHGAFPAPGAAAAICPSTSITCLHHRTKSPAGISASRSTSSSVRPDAHM